MQKTRAFICIDFPTEVIKEVARIQEILEKQKFTGKLTELENLHLTLKFLGSLDDEQLKKVNQILSNIKFNNLTLKLDKVGTFSFKGNPKIAWIKITGNVFQLQKQIDSSLEHLFPKEKRFMSHLTIARIKHVKTPSTFKTYVSKIKAKPISFEIKEFKLKSSELHPIGPQYQTLKEFKSSQ